MKQLFLGAILWSIVSFAAFAQSNGTPSIEGVETRRAAIEAAGVEIETNPDIDLSMLREQLRLIRSEAITASRPMRAMRAELQGDIDRLGPAPEESGTEAADIAETRSALNAEFRKTDETIRQADLNIAQVGRLLADIADLRRSSFYNNVLERGPSPLSPAVWGAALQSFSDGRAKLGEIVTAQQVKQKETMPGAFPLIAMIGAILFALMMFWPVRRWTDQRIIQRLESQEPTSTSRTAMAAVRTLTRIVPAIIGGYAIYETARAQGFIDEQTQGLAAAFLTGLISIFIIDGVVTAVFAPKTKAWRLIPVSSSSAISIRILLWLAAGLFALDAFFNSGGGVLGTVSELTRLQSSVVAVLGASLLWMLTRKRLWTLPEEQADFAVNSRANWDRLRQVGQIIAIGAIIATILGYSALSRFVVTRIFFLAAVLALGWFVRALVHEVIAHYRSRAVARAAADELIEEDEERLVFFWIGIIIDIVILAALSPLVMVLLGFEWVEVRDFLRDAFFGFQVGSVTISVAQILTAIATFILIMMVTRFIQRGADKRVFSQARIDEGLRNSFRTLIGYVGMVIAALSAVTMLGFDLASLAFIAGALSLGIGFGLQSIVNNFVSGLILLFERPIKVGDWIVVGSGEGIVKRISVRSTEIETFDRSSIIVPNSELISSSVTNWTHKDKYTRITVHVGVSYNEDPDSIIALLKSVVNANARVVKTPPPVVYFGGFGDSSLDFEMRVFIKQTSDHIPVQNELRVSTFNAFKEAGVEIPFPQRDLHVRSMPDTFKADENNTDNQENT